MAASRCSRPNTRERRDIGLRSLHSLQPLRHFRNLRRVHARRQVLSPSMRCELARQIPARFAVSDWRLLYSTHVHGMSLATLYNRSEECGGCIVRAAGMHAYAAPGAHAARPRVTIARVHVSQIAIRASSGRIFGGFASEMRSPTPPEKFYGSGESFLFRIDGKLR